MNTANGPGISSLEAALSEVERRGGTAWDITPNLAATTARAAAKAPTAAIFVHGAVRDGYVIGFGITTSDKDVVPSLTADGWVVNFDQPDRVGLGKKWVVRSTADRSVLMQDVNGALARIGPQVSTSFGGRPWAPTLALDRLRCASHSCPHLSEPSSVLSCSSRRELRRSLPRSERPSRVRSSAGFRFLLGAGGTPSYVANPSLPPPRGGSRAGLRHGGAAGRGTRSDHFGGYELADDLSRRRSPEGRPASSSTSSACEDVAVLRSVTLGLVLSSWPRRARWSSNRRCQLARRRSRPKYETRQGSRRRSSS